MSGNVFTKIYFTASGFIPSPDKRLCYCHDAKVLLADDLCLVPTLVCFDPPYCAPLCTYVFYLKLTSILVGSSTQYVSAATKGKHMSKDVSEVDSEKLLLFGEN